jgi:predicted lactoylglutathione lyase
MKKNITNNLILELHIPDFDIAKDFYQKLGFEIGIEDRPSSDEVGYMTMIRKDNLGQTILNFYGGNKKVSEQSFFKQFPKETIRGYGVEITIPVKNIHEIYTIAQNTLGRYIVRELKEIEDQGQVWKDFRMTDPFGFYLRFTELIDWGQR